MKYDVTCNIDRASLERASAESANWPHGWYNAIFYDPDTGEVWCVPEAENSWHSYGSGVRRILNTAQHISVERIEAAIRVEMALC